MARLPRRLGSRLFALAAGVSLVLCVGVCALWVRSLSVSESVGWNTPYTEPPFVWRKRAVGSERGQVAVFLYRGDYPPLTADEREGWSRWYEALRQLPSGWRYSRPVSFPDTPNDFLGFGFLHDAAAVVTRLGGDNRKYTIQDDRTILAIPYWFMAVVSGGLPLSWTLATLKRHKREGRRRAGLCPRCGYDLRASLDRCPECGTVPDQKWLGSSNGVTTVP